MIVTCPGCAAKYRVRDESVPPEGAQLQCPSCQATFVAMPPKHSDEELSVALERLNRAKEAVDQQLFDVTRSKAAVEARLADAEQRAHEAMAQAKRLEAALQAQAVAHRTEVEAARSESLTKLRALESEAARARDEAARAALRASGAGAAEARVVELTTDIAHMKAAHEADTRRQQEELQAALKATARLATELEASQKKAAIVEAELAALRAAPAPDAGRVAELEREVERLRGEATPRHASSAPVDDARLRALVSAIGPMLWGLTQAIAYLEPFGAAEPVLAGHLRQLQLLEAVLKKIEEQGT